MRKRIVALTIVCTVLLTGALTIADEFEWMPKGGCDLLQAVIASSKNNVDILQELEKKKSQAEWNDYLQSKEEVIKSLNKKGLDTLAAYLSNNFPLEEDNSSRNPKKLDCATLPPDGKTLTLEKCTLCHPIAPFLTEERSIEGWRGAYDLPPMPQAGLSEKEIETLIHYLAYNTPIPEEEIPIEMKMPLPGY